MLCERISSKGCWRELEEAAIRMVCLGGISAMGFYRDAAGLAGAALQQDPLLQRLLKSYAAESKNPPTFADLDATASILRAADDFLTRISHHLTCSLTYLGEETVTDAYRAWLAGLLGSGIAAKIHAPSEFFEIGDNVLRVILDGLDGTANFTRGIPLFCSAAAILVDRQPRVAAVYDPIHNIVYSGVLPGPARRPEENARVTAWEVAAGMRTDLAALSDRDGHLPLSKEAVAIHLTRANPTKMREFLGCLERLALASNAIYAFNTGIPAMCHIARGGLGAYVNNFTNLWDVAAGEVIVRASGGKVTDFAGDEIKYDSHGRVSLLAAKAHLHAEIQKLLTDEAARSAVAG
jgi:fructose-1,6-bisphosphatase/inositol monophosphatase family enzyme